MEKKPDFKVKAKEYAQLIQHCGPLLIEACELDFEAGCNFTHDTYVTPLQSQLSEAEKRNERLLSALKELHKESYDLREHCQDRGYLDFNEPDNDGVVQFNAALENTNQILNNTKSDGDAFLLHLIDVTACFVMEQNMLIATPTRKELIDKARSTFKQSN